MIKKQLYFLIICFLSIGLNAQTITLKGTVENSLQQPLTYANVIAKPTDSLKALKKANYKVSDVKKGERNKKPPLPLLRLFLHSALPTCKLSSLYESSSLV